jgi:predicted chitinase
MRAHEFITEISRRGFLKGAGAATLAGAALSPFVLNKSEIKKPEVVKPEVVKPEVVKPEIKNPGPVSKNPAYEQLLIKKAQSDIPSIKGVELAQLLGQCYHETAGFTSLKEKGGPRYFKRLYDITRNPNMAKILGNLHLGDGVRYHGRGFIHLTGRSNYKSAGKYLSIDLIGKPELAEEPENAAHIAVWYWIKKVRPYVNDFNDTAAVTKRINPRLEGLSSRVAAFDAYLKTMK